MIDTSKLNVHELRALISANFHTKQESDKIVVYVNSFGFRHGVPPDSDLVFDVRFLPNPNYIPEVQEADREASSVVGVYEVVPANDGVYRPHFRAADLFIAALHREGKSYLTIGFGCTGGHHRSVLIASEIHKRLKKGGYSVKEQHRDVKK